MDAPAWRWGNIPIPQAHLVGPRDGHPSGPQAMDAWTVGYVGVALVAGTAWPLMLLPVVLAMAQVVVMRDDPGASDTGPDGKASGF
jgi:hypothetical protein